MKGLAFYFILLLVGCETAVKPTEVSFITMSNDSLRYVIESGQIPEALLVHANGEMGIRYNMMGKYDSARIYLNRALDLPGGKEYQAGRLVTNLANSYGFEGNYTEALKYYIAALKISEQLLAVDGDNDVAHFNIIRSMANLAEIYYLTGNHEQALLCARQAQTEESRRTANTSYITPQYLYIIGLTELDKGLWNQAEQNMTLTYQVARIVLDRNLLNNNSPEGMYMYAAYGKEGQARVHLARKDYANALECATQALAYAEQHSDLGITAKMLSTISDIYLAKADYEQSGYYATKALELCPDYAKLNPETEFNIASAHLFAGNTGKAYTYFRLYSERMKENTDRQFHETMAGMQIVYETERKEARISSLEKQHQLYVWLAVVGILFMLALLGALWQTIRSTKKEKQFIATRSVLDGEMRERSRIAQDLHDRLSAGLAAVKIELSNQTETLQNVRNKLDNCIRDIRDAAHGLMPISLQAGLKVALEDFAAQFPNVDFHFFGQEKHIDKQLEFVVYCCANELVNNAIKHSGAKGINLQLVQDEKYVTLTVSDNGSGYDEKSIKEGFGLKSIRNRIASCNGKIDIVTAPGRGTETTIELKLP